MIRRPALLFFLVAATFNSKAYAWDLFRRENPDVREGNERFAAQDFPGAIQAYDRAARALPIEPRVHLNRGIALLEAEQIDAAREALRLATEPPAPAEIRAAAHYNLGLSWYRAADAAAAAQEPNHAEAQRMFREAADAFRASLRQQPGNRDAAWNLELALRRIRDEEEAQEREQQNEQNEQSNDQQQQNQDSQNQDPQQNQPSDENTSDSPEENGENQQPEEPSQEPSSSQSPGEQRSDQGQREGNEQQQQQQGEQVESETRGRDMERVLDALEDGEESAQRAMARSRGQRQDRRVLEDW